MTPPRKENRNIAIMIDRPITASRFRKNRRATLASIGTAGTSGAGMIMLAMVLDAVGIDPTYIGLIYGVDRLFDMGRTSLNVIGDASCAICVNYWEGNAKKAAAKKA